MLARRCLAATANGSQHLQCAAGLSQLSSSAYGVAGGGAASAAVGGGRCYAGSAGSGGEAPADIRKAFAYCVEQVKKHDYENYLWVTQLPKVGTHDCAGGWRLACIRIIKIVAGRLRSSPPLQR